MAKVIIVYKNFPQIGFTDQTNKKKSEYGALMELICVGV
jgi:hypothetical protein